MFGQPEQSEDAIALTKYPRPASQTLVALASSLTGQQPSLTGKTKLKSWMVCGYLAPFPGAKCNAAF